MMKIRNIKESMQVARGAGASMVAVVMLLMAFSCEKNVIPTPEEVRTPACISADNGSSDTKSALDGLTFTWAAGDKISLFHDNSGTAMNEQFSIVKTAGTFNPSESFDGTVTGWTSGDKTFYGVYPYNATTSNYDRDNVKYTFALPANQTQTYASGIIDKTGIGKYLYMIGTSADVPYADPAVIPMSFSDNSQSPSANVSSMSVALNGAPAGSVTARLVMFPVTLASGTVLKYTVTVKNSDNTINSYIVTQDALTSDVSLSAGKRNTTSVTVPTGIGTRILSDTETSNCYIVSAAGSYRFDATIIGNGANGLLPSIAQTTKKFHTESVDITPLSAQVLWQDVDGLVSSVSLSSGMVTFIASADKGNAIIAVYDNADPTTDGANILWSWHIWCTDTPSTHGYVTFDRSTGSTDPKYPSKNLTVMDRNLGATRASYSSTDAELLATYGLLYQWGRKDPFPGSQEITSNIEKTLYGAVTSITKTTTSSDNGTIANTIANPEVFYKGVQGDDFDWYYDSTHNEYLWGNPTGFNATYTATKTIYDPCPPGYMVAPADTWTQSLFGNNNYDFLYFNVMGSSTDFTCGWNFYYEADHAGSTAWYPAAGRYIYNKDFLGNVGSSGYYWSSSTVASLISSFSFIFSAITVQPLFSNSRANGFSVRCLQE